MKELAKQYDPSQVEDRIYQFWLDGGYFHTKADPDKKPYTIVMPPPNVTGQLHMGHAVDNTMQDILIRTKRMQGYAALWVPGTDHASIATEAKVVEAMRAEGLTKEMVGRDGFLERAWAWKTKYGNRIVSQLKKLGSSCDWERERFTMDEGCSEAVKEVFVRLYDKGLIYRGNRMVNWCPHCNTSISDAEVEYEEKDGHFWHLLYPVKETGEMLELIDAVDNPAVQICIDTGHANMVGLDVPAMIRQVGTHLKATHINDNHGKTDEHFAPYNGTIPWKETVQALRDIGYQECFAFEIHHLTSMYPKEVQPAQVDFSYALGSYLLRE